MVKSQSIKKEAMYFDPSLLECDLTLEAIKSQQSQQSPHLGSLSSTRNRQADTIDLRSPTSGKRQNKRRQSSQSNGLYIVMIIYNTQ